MFKHVECNIHMAKPPQVRTMGVFHRQGQARQGKLRSGKVSMDIFIDILGEDLFVTKDLQIHIFFLVSVTSQSNSKENP